MSNASHLPLALYRANLELWLRIGQLLEDNREQWSELLGHELQERVAAAGEGSRLQSSADWSSLMVPGSGLWQLAEQQVADLQALARDAGGNQMTFVNGFQQALEQWRQDTTDAFGQVAGGAAVSAEPFQALRENLESLSSALLSGFAPSASGSGAARGGSAASTPRTRSASPGGGSRTSARSAAGAPTRTPARKAAKSARSTGRKVAKKASGPATKRATKKAAKKTARSPARKAAAKVAKAPARKAAKNAARRAPGKVPRKVAKQAATPAAPAAAPEAAAG